ncbi:MAG: PQQ-dependent sugar dehydrogenase [bacterium]|nr:PQQ-dependent sugar dehydrogenase [bacterium]
MRKIGHNLLCMSFVLTTAAAHADPDGAALYGANCAQCHGAELQGGNAQSLVDGVWQFGGGEWGMASTIQQGITHLGMPAFGLALARDEIDAIVAFLQSQEQAYDPQPRPLPQTLQSQEYDIAVEVLATGLEIPWSVDFIDAHTALITERPGRLRMVSDGVLAEAPVRGTPTVLHEGQGGLMDVAVDPDFGDNGWIYLSYSHVLSSLRDGDERPASMTRIVRGRIVANVWTDEQVLFEAPHETYITTRHHYGSRIVFDARGDLYFSIGDRGRGPLAQDLTRPNGKVHRIHRDGTIVEDNPFVHQAGALPSIFSYGHRNPQGLAVHPETDRLWESEHGPMGGDEVNAIHGGGNYGWPEISYGRNYNGSQLTAFERKPGMEQPAWVYRPSSAVCGLDIYEGEQFPKWQGHLLVGALKYESVDLLTVVDDRVIHRETIVKNLGRVRDVAVGPDGAVYVVLNGPGRVIRLTAILDRLEAAR